MGWAWCLRGGLVLMMMLPLEGGVSHVPKMRPAGLPQAPNVAPGPPLIALVAHHKSGSTVASNLGEQLVDLGMAFKIPDWPCHTPYTPGQGWALAAVGGKGGGGGSEHPRHPEVPVPRPWLLDHHWRPGQHSLLEVCAGAAGYRVVHFVRNPLTMAVSDFFYTLRGEEGWMWQTRGTHGPGPVASQIRRVPLREGVLETYWLRSEEIRTMARMYQRVDKDPGRQTNVVMEDYHSPEGMNRTIARLVRFLYPDLGEVAFRTAVTRMGAAMALQQGDGHSTQFDRGREETNAVKCALLAHPNVAMDMKERCREMGAWCTLPPLSQVCTKASHAAGSQLGREWLNRTYGCAGEEGNRDPCSEATQ